MVNLNQPRFREIFGDEPKPVSPLKRLAVAQVVPRSRESDPRSSKRAESDMKRNGTIRGQALIVLQLVRDAPGRSSKELGTMGSLDRYAVARRLPELRDAGLVRSESRSKNDVAWFPL